MNKLKMIYENIKKTFSRSLTKNSTVMIYSVLLSVTMWFFVSMAVYPTISVSVHDIPIVVDITGTSVERNGLQVVTPEEEIPTITVKVEGRRNEIGSISADDLVARVALDNVNNAGTYKLPITVESASGLSFTVTDMSQNSVTLDFDEVISRSFELVGSAPGMKAADGYLTGELICSPSMIVVTGPRERVESITSVVLHSDETAVLSQSFSFPASEIILYSGSTVLSNEYFTFDRTSFSLEMQLYMMKSLPLVVNFSNYQSGFDPDKLDYSLSADYIEVSAPNSILDNVDEIVLDTIDIRELDLTENHDENGNYSIELPINIPDSYENISGTDTVTLTFNCADIVKQRVTLDADDFYIVGASSDYEVSIVTVEAYANIIGSSEVMEHINELNVRAVIDLSNTSISNSTFVAPYSVRIDQTYGPAWALGAQTVVLRATERE